MDKNNKKISTKKDKFKVIQLDLFPEEELERLSNENFKKFEEMLAKTHAPKRRDKRIKRIINSSKNN